MKKALIASVFVAATALSGCVPLIAGALIYDNADDRDAREKFTANFNQQNLDREKAGLKPLDWCSEAYKAKKSWTGSDKNCSDRVKRYEAGDTAALTI